MIQIINGENFVTETNDVIDNAVYDAISSLVPEGIEWNMEHIGECTDLLESYLRSKEIYTCHPYYSDETCCFKSKDRCQYCCYKQYESGLNNEN